MGGFIESPLKWLLASTCTHVGDDGTGVGSGGMAGYCHAVQTKRMPRPCVQKQTDRDWAGAPDPNLEANYSNV